MHPESRVVESADPKAQEVALFIVQDARRLLEADVPKALECRVCPTCHGSGKSFHLFDQLFLERDVDFKLAVTM